MIVDGAFLLSSSVQGSSLPHTRKTENDSVGSPADADVSARGHDVPSKQPTTDAITIVGEIGGPTILGNLLWQFWDFKPAKVLV
jgi:hypothetical protein